MPGLSRFYGIVVQMYFGITHPRIFTRSTQVGRPSSMSRPWPLSKVSCQRAQEELREAFRRAEAMEAPTKIAPLP